MNLKHYYYYFQSALPPRVIDDILAYGKSMEMERAVTGEVQADDAKDETGKVKPEVMNNVMKKRKSDIVWMDDTWIYREIHPYIREANAKAGWNFQWDRSESCQFTKYGVGQYYGWHQDSWHKPYSRPPLSDGSSNPEHGKIRKLSCTISLSHPDEYEGGNLEFDLKNENDIETYSKKEGGNLIECTEIRPRGSIIIFPSFVWHRVKPVTKGTRYSLVVWNLGWPFR